MSESTVHPQVQFDGPMISRLALIQQSIESAGTVQPGVHPSLAQSPVKKFKLVVSDNSMFRSGMGFFVCPAQALTNVLKRDQLPAWL